MFFALKNKQQSKSRAHTQLIHTCSWHTALQGLFPSMELLPYRKCGALVSGENPEMELHTSLSAPDRDTIPREHTLASADTAPFIIYGKLPQQPPWMPSFPLCRDLGPRPRARAIPPSSRFGDKDGHRHIICCLQLLWELMLQDPCCIVV